MSKRKEPTKAIYLQWEGLDKADIPANYPDEGHEEVTWCHDKIYDTDVRYILDKRYKVKP